MSDAPKAKPAAKTEGKPAAAAPAAAKAPAKAAAKGAAKGAAKAKPVVEKREGPRKKSKTPLVASAPNPQIAINKKLREEQAANKKATGAKKYALIKKRAERKKAIKEAKKKGLPKPKLPKVKRSEKNKARKARIAARAAASKKVADPALLHQRFVLRLTPLNQWFQNRFGFIFSEFIGKAREKALRARNVKVVVHQPGHVLNGRAGSLIYYTGKHRGFVKIGHATFKLPFHFLFKQKVYHAEITKRLFLKKQGRRAADHATKLRAHKKAAEQAKKDGKPAPALPKELAAPFQAAEFKELTPRGKRAPKKDRKNKTKPVAKAANTDPRPPKPFKNVGNPHKNKKGLLVALEKAKLKKARAEKPKKDAAKKRSKKARNARNRRNQKGKPHAKPAADAAAAVPAVAKPAAAAKSAAKPAAAKKA